MEKLWKKFLKKNNIFFEKFNFEGVSGPLATTLVVTQITIKIYKQKENINSFNFKHALIEKHNQQ